MVQEQQKTGVLICRVDSTAAEFWLENSTCGSREPECAHQGSRYSFGLSNGGEMPDNTQSVHGNVHVGLMWPLAVAVARCNLYVVRSLAQCQQPRSAQRRDPTLVCRSAVRKLHSCPWEVHNHTTSCCSCCFEGAETDTPCGSHVSAGHKQDMVPHCAWGGCRPPFLLAAGHVLDLSH